MRGSTVLGGRYELGRTLGTGGMARVFAGRDRTLDRRVAIKLMHEHVAEDGSSRERLLREARAAAGLQHLHTVAVYDVGDHYGRPFIVMELVEGGSLADRLDSAGRVDVDEAVGIARAVLAALAAAHQQGFVHRDVKPSNILLPASGGVKLADFGIATALGAASTRLTGTGLMVGTPRYVAPEQAAGKPPTPASDVYSLGVVLFECLAGRAPFEADSPLAEALAHQRDRVPSLTGLAPHVPAGIAAVVQRALDKDPGGRYPDAERMRAALAEPGGAARRAAGTLLMPAGAGDPGMRWRRRALAVAVAALLLGAVALVALPDEEIAGPSCSTSCVRYRTRTTPERGPSTPGN